MNMIRKLEIKVMKQAKIIEELKILMKKINDAEE